MTHPDILAVEREGYLTTPRTPRCPVCGSEDLEDIYYDKDGILVGCDCCLTWQSAVHCEDAYREE